MPEYSLAEMIGFGFAAFSMGMVTMGVLLSERRSKRSAMSTEPRPRGPHDHTEVKK